jgi:hypothetical protein
MALKSALGRIFQQSVIALPRMLQPPAGATAVAHCAGVRGIAGPATPVMTSATVGRMN